ncbi:MAG: response regulator [Oceanospirillales bacterium]|nr:response regulator [Oceanospirillales bacterium]MBR9888216.1 response regulator [Oceanospirillales bacterium]
MKKTILVVDDAPVNLDVISGILAPHYNVRVANNGALALKIANKQLPDLILLDVMMPEMDGYEVCRQLKTSPDTSSIPVIFVTAAGDTDSEIQGFDVGGVDYITKPLNPTTVLKRVETHLSLVNVDKLNRLARNAILMLGEAGHYNDEDTGKHIWRMAEYARLIASNLKLPPESCEMIELAAPLHDTGKIGIPDEILKAPRKLTPEEWEIMKTHSQIGYEILNQSDNSVFKLAAEIAQSHHERWEGTGYPNGLKGTEIPLAARIVSVADVYDALTMERPYKHSWSADEAFDEIKRGANTQFDPEVVRCFLSIRKEIEEAQAKWNSACLSCTE